MSALRGGAAVALATVVAMIGGCSTTVSAPAPVPVTQPSSAAPPATSPFESHFDLPRLASAIAALPPGFVRVGQQPVVLKLIDRLVPNVSTVVSHGQPFVVEPRQCRPLLKPVDAAAGADTIRFRGDRGKEEQISVGAIEPVTVPEPIPDTGCERMSFQIDDDDHPESGVVDRLAAPSIAGATTIALKIQVEGWQVDSYSYAAILDGGGYVDVQAHLSPGSAIDEALPTMLSTAVAAVRGR